MEFSYFWGSSQTWLFQTLLFAIFTWKRSFAPFCALLRSFADLRLRSCAFICALCAHLRVSASVRV